MPKLPLTLVPFALLAAAGAIAGPLAPSRASDLVVAVTKNQTPCPISGVAFDTLFLADGTEVAFAIPEKRVLVVTSVDFVLGSSSPAGTAAAPVLAAQAGGQTRPLLQGSGVADAGGTAVGTMLSPTGVPVKPGVPLCLIGGTTPNGILHGYFAKDK